MGGAEPAPEAAPEADPPAEEQAPAEQKPGLASRAAGAAARFAEGYVHMARREAKRDLQRVVVGVVMLVAGTMLTMLSVIFAQAFLVALLSELGIAPVYTLGALLAGDLFVALILFVVGRALVRQPLLPQSRKVLKDTVDMFQP